MDAPQTDWRSAWTILFGSAPPARLADVDPTEVKRVFRIRARETHPDVAGHTATGQFRSIVVAYESLMAAARSEGVRRPPAQGQIRVSDTRTARFTPGRPLALSQFLFHLGWVSWDAAVASVRWQREHRAKLGQVAIDVGALTVRDVQRVLNQQGRGERFGDCAARLGLMARDDVFRLLERQRRLQPLVGQYFVQSGLLTADQVREAVARQRAHNQAVNGT